jgi:hypothetical protein
MLWTVVNLVKLVEILQRFLKEILLYSSWQKSKAKQVIRKKEAVIRNALLNAVFLSDYTVSHPKRSILHSHCYENLK